MPKKLIEVALPLEAINVASAREKSIRHGHPSTLHLWWARRPLAACRAVLFASLVDDPSAHPEAFPTEAAQDAERQRLFGIIERLVQWENSNNPEVLNEARAEILKSTQGNPPPVLDPFCGGGSIPLEAQRLGLEAHGSDLNPVAVLITKALIEIPPKFAGQPPINPDARQGLAHSGAWQGATGLAEDVRYYGKWMRDEAEKRIGHLYPKATLPDGGEATVIAWIWARTVKCPNPACGCQMPLVRSFALSTKAGKQAWVEPSSPGPFSRAAGEGEIRGNVGLQPDIRRGVTHIEESVVDADEPALRPDIRHGASLEAQVGEMDPALKLAAPSPEIIQKARALRQTATTAEQLLWEFVRDRRLAGCKFRRQHPLGRFIADFYCAEARLVVELDGSVHQETDQQQRDQIREETLRANNLRVLRFSNERVMTQTSDVLNELSQALTPTPSPTEWERGQGVRASFTVRTGAGGPRAATVGKRGAVCLCCNAPVPLDHVRAEGKAKRMGAQLMAIVAEGVRGRIYLSPTPEQENIAKQAVPDWKPDTTLPEQALGFRVQGYGMTTHASLFTQRQLVALTTFSDLVGEAREKASEDAVAAGYTVEQARSYSDAVTVYLAFAVDKMTDTNSSLCTWQVDPPRLRATFSRQALPMTWDYAEANAFADAAGDYQRCIGSLVEVLEKVPPGKVGRCSQNEATLFQPTIRSLYSTDPPYYDNVPYADLSDFFYVWLRRSLGGIYPALFGTMLVPKVQELIADPFRQGGKEASRQFFEDGMKCVFTNICQSAHADYPVTVYYAFKQSEAEEDEDRSDSRTVTASTGWETMLQGLIEAGFQITGTWPMRTELSNRMRGLGSNALASSIVLVCRPRAEDAPIATRREFVNALRRELEEALLKMMHGNIAPVDLAQATIGPGMAVYSRYSKVVEADGSPVRVRQALQIINQELDTVLSAQEGDYDVDTRFCLTWFEQFGMNPGAFGDADNMARAKNTSVGGMEESGVLEARGGKVRLLKREEYPADWNPAADARIPVWECTQQLVRALLEQGEGGAARLCHALGSRAEPARDLAYRLYSLCERKGWAQEALAYNSLVIAWPEITRIASSPNIAMPQTGLFAGGEL